LFCFIALSLFALLTKGQDAPQSLGDVARKTRQQKQQTKNAPDKAKAAKTPRVITDDEVLHSVSDTSASASSDLPDVAPSQGAATAGKLPPEQWKSRILEQKNAVTALQDNIAKVSDSIQFAPGNCVSGCVEWNERQKQKQAEVERMQEQLKEQQKRLEETQEAARQQGYGGSVTDP